MNLKHSLVFGLMASFALGAKWGGAESGHSMADRQSTQRCQETTSVSSVIHLGLEQLFFFVRMEMLG